MRFRARAVVLPALLLLVLLSSAPAAVAQTGPVGTLLSADALDIARAVLTAGTFDTIMTQAGKIGSQVVRASLEGRLARSLTASEASRLQDLFTRLLRETAPQSEWETLYATLISRNFTPDELRELAAFYRTPLGSRVTRLSGVMMTEGAAAGERLMKSREREMVQRFGAEFAREFPALSREIERQPSR